MQVSIVLHNVPPQKKPVQEYQLKQIDRKHILKAARLPKLKSILRKFEKYPRFKSWFIAAGLKDRIIRLVHYQPITEYDNPKNPAWLLMKAILEDWIKNDAASALLIPIPLYHHVMQLSEPSNYNARLSEIAFSTGCKFYDPLKDLTSYPLKDKSQFYFVNDGHLTQKGHIALAKSLYGVIRRILKLENNMGKTDE